MLIATAGHIDHGKTALVRALTGVETDRLPEERARGISIDLGFAWWRPDRGAPIGFVDVPGHEKLVRNMLAGLSGIDFVLLVVAADEGVKPQTVEHLRMIDLLGIVRGAVVLTRCDRASPERIAAVRAEVGELLALTGLSALPLFETAAPLGAGIPELQAALVAARDTAQAGHSAGHGFRLAIDRAFTVAGAGTVVTGTVLAGKVTPGETLVLAPQGSEVRVRGIQSAGESIDQAAAGQRCALNLAGVERSAARRGDWLVAAGLHAPTTRIDARLTLLAPLRHDTAIHLHLGAAQVGARVLTARQRSLQPGDDEVVRLVLESPASAVCGERFILRDQSGRELLGGGTVLDPLATVRRQPLATRQAVAAAQSLEDPRVALIAMSAIAGFEPELDWFGKSRNHPQETVNCLADDPELIRYGDRTITRNRCAALGDALVTALARHHRDHPEQGGMTRREARIVLGEPVSSELLAALIGSLEATGQVESAGALLRLPGHSASFSQAETALWNGTLAMLEARGPRPIVLAELARELRAGEAALRAMLFRRRTNGDVWQVTDSKFMLREHVATLAEIAARLEAEHGGFTAAQFRDASGIGRNFVIELLEFLDRIGATRRLGAVRKMRADWQAVTGGGAN